MTRQHKKQLAISLGVLILLFLTTQNDALAELQYKLLETVGDPGGPQVRANTAFSFQEYVSVVYRFLYRGTIAVSVVMLVIAGAEYAASGVTEAGKKDAKEKINNVFFGLLGLMTAYFILYQINPAIVTVNLDSAIEKLGKVDVKTGIIPTTPGVVAPPAFQTSGTKENTVPVSPGKRSRAFGTEDAVREELGVDNPSSQIKVNRDPCPLGKVFVKGQSSGCTNLDGLGTDAVIGLKQLQEACDCEIVITGGTEGPGIVHESHGPGKSQVDLRLGNETKGLDQYITQNYERKRETSLGTEYVMKNGDIYRDETAGTRHWHVIFNANREI